MKVRCLFGVAVATCLLLAVEARAASCSRDCGSPCTDGCTIDSPGSTCGASCHGGQCPGGTVTCEQFGGTVNECNYSISSNCGGGAGPPPIENPVPLMAPGAPQWAVVEYHARRLYDKTATVHPDIQVLAASGLDFAKMAKNEMVRNRRLSSELELPAFGPIEAKRRLQFNVSSPGGCSKARLDLGGNFLFEPPAVRRAILFDLVADESGRIVHANPLFSEAAERSAGVAAYLQENARLTAEEAGPLQAFAVMVLNPDGTLGYLLVGGRRLSSGPSTSDPSFVE